MLTQLTSKLGRCLLAASIAGLTGPVAAWAGDQPAAAPVAKPAESRFDVHEYRVLGNTVLPDRVIEETLYPLLGDAKTLSDVEIARAALEKTYHDRGYGTVFVDIPEQEVAEKIVRLRVTEGRLNEVRIGGARYYSEQKIMAAVPAATPGTVPNLPALQSQLSAVNYQSADRSVVPILKAGALPGTVDLALKVDDHIPVHGSLELDNQRTPETTPLRATASVSYGNLFQRFDNFSVQYQASPADFSQVSVIAANYAFGALDNGIRPSLYFVNSNSNVPTVGTIGVIGKGQIFGTRFAIPLTDTLGMPQSLTVGLDYKHFKQSIGLPDAPAVNTPISYLNLSLAYGGVWSSDWLQGSLNTGANFGVRGAVNDPEAFANKRYRGGSNYFYVRLGGALSAKLPKGFQLILRADGQLAVEPLITNEDFSIAGADGVRGYLEAEVLGDSGVKTSLQLQTPSLNWGKMNWGDAFVFYDIGQSNIIDPLPGEPGATSLRSYGLGVHLLPSYWINGSFTWADPRLNGPNTRGGSARMLFLVRAVF